MDTKKLWTTYRQLINDNISENAQANTEALCYWRSKLFSRILLYLLPVSVIALVPGVVMSIKGGIPMLAIYDILAVGVFIFIVVSPNISLHIRKVLFVLCLYLLAIILLAYLGSMGPALLYLLTITVFTSLIFDGSIAYYSIAVNAAVCVFFAVVIHLKLIDTPLTAVYSLGAWIAVSSNVVFLSIVVVASLQLLFNGLQATISKENELSKQLQTESEALEKMLDTLQTKNHELEQFAYIASHDLQEPLQSISSFAALLDNQYREKLDDKAVKYLDYLAQSTTNMRLLISGLLEYARIGRDKQLETVDCNQILQEVIHELAAVIAVSKATISLQSLPTLMAYPSELKQLFQHLVSNAIKFRKDNISPEIMIQAQDTDNEWIFSVADNGIGIEKRFHEKIFMIYQRLHPKSRYTGTGIGLAHGKKIVELHQGRIWLESQPGVGSIFYFNLPKIHHNDGYQIKLHFAH